jgi:hypothetical protein
MNGVKRISLILCLVVGWVALLGSTPSVQAQPTPPSANLAKSLSEVYTYWRKAMVSKDYNAWKQITASHRKMAIKNRILSEKGNYPADIFKVPGTPPTLNGLKLLRARSKGVTAKLVYFGKVDFGVGGTPPDNLLVLSFLHEGRGWKYDTAEFINLSALKDVRAQLQAGNLKYIDNEAFMPNGKRPAKPITVRRAQYIAKVYTYCPGREVRVTVNKISKHRFQDTQQSEVVIGGVRDNINEIHYFIKDLPGYKGSDPLTLRVYVFSQIPGVKPVKVFQYQVNKGEKPKLSGSGMFTVDAATAAKIRGK